MLLSDLSTGQNKWKKSFPWHQRSSTCCAHYPGVVLCKSLGRGVPLEHWNSYPIREHDQLDFATMLQTRHQTLLPATLSQARYFHHCKNFITIVVQHTPTTQTYKAWGRGWARWAPPPPRPFYGNYVIIRAKRSWFGQWHSREKIKKECCWRDFHNS